MQFMRMTLFKSWALRRWLYVPLVPLEAHVMSNSKGEACKT